jgi:hypothetical protein
MPTLDRVFSASTNPSLAETGGGHNQKGVDFQRYWAILRALALEEGGSADFVLYFETLQDVLELDSENAPTSARIYQVKKKDSGEWDWRELTALENPPTLKADGTPRKKRQPKDPEKAPTFADSPIGKLEACARFLSDLETTAYFISNAGCALPLTTPPGGSASAAQQCHLGQLETWYATTLDTALMAAAQAANVSKLDPSKIRLERTTVHPEAPQDAITGRASILLSDRSPAHAAQAQTLVQSLFVAISAKGRHTGQCETMDELRKKRGFGRRDLQASLAQLERVPDLATMRSNWMQKLLNEGFDLMSHTRMQVALSELERERLSGVSGTNPEFSEAVRAFVIQTPPGDKLGEFLEAGANALTQQFPDMTRTRLYAHLLNEGISQCVDQTLEN